MGVCNDEDGVSQARRNDPWAFSFGCFLRRTSLHELPQFINVLHGPCLSWVRVRMLLPITRSIAIRLGGYMWRHKVKPGITGLAQIKGWRSETDTLEKMEWRIDYVLGYIRKWSLWLDLEIIVLTVFTGFLHKNTY